MPFREPTLSLRDILDSIEMIVQFVRGMDLEAFRQDPKTIAAVELARAESATCKTQGAKFGGLIDRRVS